MNDSGKRALVAEDNSALCRVMALTLRGAGFEVTAARNGREAWDFAQETEFDVVVTDQQMPEMTGLELVEQLRGSDTHADTPVVLLTAKGMELELGRLRERYGVAAMLSKPFSPAELAKVAESLVGLPA